MFTWGRLSPGSLVAGKLSESLFVTVVVYVTSWPRATGFAGDCTVLIPRFCAATGPAAARRTATRAEATTAHRPRNCLAVPVRMLPLAESKVVASLLDLRPRSKDARTTSRALPSRALTGGFALPGYGLLWRATRRLVHSALVRVPVALRGVADVPADLLGCVGCARADVLGGVGCVRADVLRRRGDLVRSLGRGVGRPLGDALGRRLGRAALADRLLSGTPLAGLDGLALLGRLVRGALLSGLLVPGVARLHCSSSSLVDVG